MLREYLQHNITFLEEVSSWEESIQKAAEPLLKKEYITTEYIGKMITNINENGPYIVIVPGIAMPHAQNEGEVLGTGISMLKLQKPVLYPENKEVTIIMALAAEDNTTHLDLIADLSSILIEEDVLNQLKQAEKEEDIIHLIETTETEDNF
ncbi:PTS sugar transporter subunit IIA [Salibacterium aidingense]|uniref:PTS sugar transporter subunit IIA n=1 Tax=Salibacterium aidingense TaxID=384933 RepID=UPI003BC07734